MTRFQEFFEKCIDLKGYAPYMLALIISQFLFAYLNGPASIIGLAIFVLSAVYAMKGIGGTFDGWFTPTFNRALGRMVLFLLAAFGIGILIGLILAPLFAYAGVIWLSAAFSGNKEVAFGILAGFALFLIPFGLLLSYLSARLSWVGMLIVNTNERLTRVLPKSWHMTFPVRWRIFGITLLGGIAAYLLSMSQGTWITILYSQSTYHTHVNPLITLMSAIIQSVIIGYIYDAYNLHSNKQEVVNETDVKETDEHL